MWIYLQGDLDEVIVRTADRIRSRRVHRASVQRTRIYKGPTTTEDLQLQQCPFHDVLIECLLACLLFQRRRWIGLVLQTTSKALLHGSRVMYTFAFFDLPKAVTIHHFAKDSDFFHAQLLPFQFCLHRSDLTAGSVAF